MQPAASEDADPRRWWTLMVLCLSLLVIGLDNTILNVALPTLSRDLDASSSELQWIVDSYMLVFAGVLLSAGALGDRFGRKRALVFGLIVFGLGSGLSAIATTSEMLIATRALMGIGGAFIMPSTLSILTAVFPAHERPKAIGIWAGVSGLGIAIGPVTGGWLLEHGDWSLVFLVNLPFVLGTLIAARKLIPESRDPASPKLDLGGFALSFAGLTALVWGIIEAGGEKGWGHPVVLGALGAAVVILGAFVAWELRVREPMLDVRLFRNRRFSAASVSISLAFFSLFGMIFFLTQYLQSVLGYSALQSGLRVMPVAAGLIVGGPLSAKLTARVGAKVVVAAGLSLVATAMVMLMLTETDSAYGLIAATLGVLGLGMGLTMAPATDAVMGSLPLSKAGVGSAVNDTTRTTGGALGVAVLGSLLSSGYRGDMEAATQGLPGGAAETARESLSHALGVAQQVGGATGARLTEAAETAFVSGMHSAALIAALIAAAGAVVALVALPAREAPAAAPAAEPAGEAGELVAA